MDEQAKIEAKDERKRYREFTVTPGLTGFKVRIGCSELYFSNTSALIAEIHNYLNDPQKTERKFQNENIRLSGSMEPPPEPTGPDCSAESSQPRLRNR